jgi:hypothetical protein
MPQLIKTSTRSSCRVFWKVALLLLVILGISEAQSDTVRNELILEVKLEENRLQTDILGYQTADRFFLALGELSDLLQFPISIDADAGLAGGWFIQEEREFALNVDDGLVIAGDEKLALAPSAIFAEGSELFVDTEVLEAWFPLQFEVNMRELTLDITTDETLPVEESLKRSSRKLAKPGFTRVNPQLPLKESPYQAFGHRGTDARITVSGTRKDDDASPTHRLTSSLLSRGDLAWMTSTLFLSGDEDELTGARLTLERSQFDGPAGLNHVEVGDVVNTIGSGNRGIGLRGGSVNRSATGRYSDDTIDLEGDILPGWQVELYRNGVLIEFQEVGDDGRYQFLDIPLVFGENTFEFVFYGPYGETRRETVTHYLGPGMLGAGNIAYEISATQANQDVFDVAPPSGGNEDADSAIYNAKFNLGLTNNFTTGLRIKSYEQSDERLEDYSANINFTTAYFQLGTDYSYKETDYNQASGSLRTRLMNVGLRASYTEYLEDDLDPIYREDNPRLWSASLGSDIRLQSLPLNLTAGFLKREQSTSANGAIGTTYTPTYNTKVSSSLTYNWSDARELGNDITNFAAGGISVSTVARPWVIRSFINYDIHPDPELAFGGVSGSLQLDNDLSMNFDIERDFRRGINRYRAGYNWDFETFRISPQMTYDSEERFLGLITISTNFATRPDDAAPLFSRFSQANQGGVLARAFLDTDGDGQLDENEQALPGVDFHAQQSYRTATSDAQGNAYLERLSAYRQTDIRLDRSTLPNAELQPQTEGNSVLPRPGHWDILNVPVIVTSELEGAVQTVNDSGALEPASRMQVFLRDTNGKIISSQRTAFDGRFIFTDVPPGQYSLTLDQDIASRVRSEPELVTVTTQSQYYQGLDFVVTAEEKPSLASDQAPGPDRKGMLVDPSKRDSIIPTDIIQSQPLPEPRDKREPDAAEAADEPVSTGDWLVQVGAYSSSSSALSAWEQLQRSSALLRDREAVTAPVKGLQRLMAGPAMGENEARELCQALTQEGIDCLVRRKP